MTPRACGSRVLGYAMLSAVLLAWACGGNDGSEAVATAPVVEGAPITEHHRAVFGQITECSGLQGPEPFERRYPNRPAPTSGRNGCMDAPQFPNFPCSPGSSKLCCYAGSYDAETLTVELPADTRYGDAFDHESYRHLLYVNGDERWDDFNLPNLPSGCPGGIR